MKAADVGQICSDCMIAVTLLCHQNYCLNHVARMNSLNGALYRANLYREHRVGSKNDL